MCQEDEFFDRERLPNLLEECHGPLMAVWNRYREQMYRRGYETQDAVNRFQFPNVEHKDAAERAGQYAQADPAIYPLAQSHADHEQCQAPVG